MIFSNSTRPSHSLWRNLQATILIKISSISLENFTKISTVFFRKKKINLICCYCCCYYILCGDSGDGDDYAGADAVAKYHRNGHPIHVLLKTSFALFRNLHQEHFIHFAVFSYFASLAPCIGIDSFGHGFMSCHLHLFNYWLNCRSLSVMCGAHCFMSRLLANEMKLTASLHIYFFSSLHIQCYECMACF